MLRTIGIVFIIRVVAVFLLALTLIKMSVLANQNTNAIVAHGVKTKALDERGAKIEQAKGQDWFN